MSDGLERLLHEKDVAGRAAWVRLFDETMAACASHRRPALTITRRRWTACPSPTRARKPPPRPSAPALGEQPRLLAHITNTLAKDKQIEDSWRGYAHPVVVRNLANHVEDEVVDALVGAVRDSYPQAATATTA